MGGSGGTSARGGGAGGQSPPRCSCECRRSWRRCGKRRRCGQPERPDPAVPVAAAFVGGGGGGGRSPPPPVLLRLAAQAAAAIARGEPVQVMAGTATTSAATGRRSGNRCGHRCRRRRRRRRDRASLALVAVACSPAVVVAAMAVVGGGGFVSSGGGGQSSFAATNAVKQFVGAEHARGRRSGRHHLRRSNRRVPLDYYHHYHHYYYDLFDREHCYRDTRGTSSARDRSRASLHRLTITAAYPDVASRERDHVCVVALHVLRYCLSHRSAHNIAVVVLRTSHLRGTSRFVSARSRVQSLRGNTVAST